VNTLWDFLSGLWWSAKQIHPWQLFKDWWNR